MEEENTCKHISELLDEVLEGLMRPLDKESKKKISLQAEALNNGENIICPENTENSLNSQ